MELRILTWTSMSIIGLLITGTGVHYFRCNTTAKEARYGKDSYLVYYCPVEGNDFDVQLAVPLGGQVPSWGQGRTNGTIRLSQHNVIRDWITLSGFSSGGSFAQQLQISYSSLFSGIASFNHAYYRCGPGTGREDMYDDACTTIGQNRTYNPDLALADIRSYEQQGLIESTQNLRNKRFYLYAGSRSAFFDLDLSLGALRIYEPLVQNLCAIKTRVQEAQQVFPTINFGRPCRESAESTLFLGSCGFSGAHEALQFLLGDVIKMPPEGLRADPFSLMSFDQTEFVLGIQGPHYMDSIGYIYVPRQCYQKSCLLHFYFHGCQTGREFNGTDHFVNSGYLEVAEANDLIIVAPQAVSSRENMIGCWDTYGLTGRLYATQRGAQVTAVRNMIARILGQDNVQRQQRGVPKENPRYSHVVFEGQSSMIKSVEKYYEQFSSLH